MGVDIPTKVLSPSAVQQAQGPCLRQGRPRHGRELATTSPEQRGALLGDRGRSRVTRQGRHWLCLAVEKPNDQGERPLARRPTSQQVAEGLDAVLDVRASLCLDEEGARDKARRVDESLSAR